MSILRFTVLGCGSSGGVPRLGGLWGACDPANPRNLRSRCSLLVERITGDKTTRVLIDTSPDMRAQLLRENVGLLDGVVFTHAHADHVHGIDDLRMIVFNRKSRLPVYADGPTSDALISRFGYAFVQPEGSPYPPILELNELADPTVIDGEGGEISFRPFEVNHGAIDALGFVIGGLAYLPDVARMNPAAWKAVEGLDVWMLDALRYAPHPTHTHVEQSLEWIAKAAPKRAILTNMHIDVDYATVSAETPDHIDAAYDGMVIELPAP